MKGIRRGALESKSLIPRALSLAQRMDQHDSDADLLAGTGNAQKGILKERRAEAAALVAAINRKPRQEHRWNRSVRRLTFERALRRVPGSDGRCRKRVEADDPRGIFRSDEHPSRAVGHRSGGMTV